MSLGTGSWSISEVLQRRAVQTFAEIAVCVLGIHELVQSPRTTPVHPEP